MKILLIKETVLNLKKKFNISPLLFAFKFNYFLVDLYLIECK